MAGIRGKFKRSGGELMTRFAKAMLPDSALVAVYLFTASAHAATEPSDPCSLLTRRKWGAH
jgi:hypothetical protein